MGLQLMKLDKDKLEASVCRDSFYEFVKRFWDSIIPEEFTDNWHIKYLCDELQIVAERVFNNQPKLYDLIINISPGTTKSTICSVMFPAWVWTRMPSARTIGTSYAFPLAMDLSRKNRDIVWCDKYLKLFPEVVLSDDQNAKSYFMNTEKGWRLAVGTGGSVTGFHAHFILVDDPVDPNGAISEAELKSANKFMTETLPTRKVDKKVTVTILIMQRLHQDDPTGAKITKSKEEGGTKIKHICLPAEINEDNKKTVKPRRLISKYKNGLMDPIRLDRKTLKENEIGLGQYGYSGQFMQTPTPLGGGMFKTPRIEIDIPPRKWKRLARVRYWDKAGTKDGGAWTAGVLMGEDLDGRFWILDVVRGQWESYEREKIIKQTAQADLKRVVIGVEQEPGSGGKESAQATVRNLAGFMVRVDRPTGDKVLRADPFSVQVNAGNVMLAPGLWNRVYLEELQFFPFSKFKDQVDASSGAFTILSKPRTSVGGM